VPHPTRNCGAGFFSSNTWWYMRVVPNQTGATLAWGSLLVNVLMNSDKFTHDTFILLLSFTLFTRGMVAVYCWT
jgi:hypothetical protein